MPKKNGGLGVKKLTEFNFSLLSNGFGGFTRRKTPIGKRSSTTFLENIWAFFSNCRQRCKGYTWKQIIDMINESKNNGIDLLIAVCKRVGNGNSTKFWKDNWIDGDGYLATRFPRLFALVVQKDASVSDLWGTVSQQWQMERSWRCRHRGRAATKLVQLHNLLHQVVLSSYKQDEWYWKIDAKGRFLVKGIYLHFCSCLSAAHRNAPSSGPKHIWNSMLPIKVNVLVWRALLNKFPLKDNMSKRGILVSDMQCVLCNAVAESGSHLFFTCVKSIGIWRKVFAWWRLSFPQPLDWSTLHIKWVGDTNVKSFDKNFLVCAA